MNKKLIIGSMLLIVFFNACREDYTSKDYLNTVLDNLNKVESASYYLVNERWSHGDTAAAARFPQFLKEYKNPQDTTIGSKFVVLDSLTKTKAAFCYDGQARVTFYSNDKTIVIDSFKVRPLPFRPLSPPFYNYVTSILKYALTTKDSITLEIKDQQTDVFVRLRINEDRQVEFFGKAFFMTPDAYLDPTSIYELWIDKKAGLPYKVRREMSHDISVRSVSASEFNKLDIGDFDASGYITKNYEVTQYGEGGDRRKANELTGKKAPAWTLQTDDKIDISLADLKSKVLMLQFTSVSCGPCRASIPFLKELQNEYKKSDFDFVAIESTSSNSNVLTSYMKRNQFDYKFLLSNKQIRKDYLITSYPVFFILDENRVVKEVINGYGKETTDDKIRAVINELIE